MMVKDPAMYTITIPVRSASVMAKRLITLFSMLQASKKCPPNTGLEDELDDDSQSEKEIDEEEVDDNRADKNNGTKNSGNLEECPAQCCSDESNAFHPNDKPTVQSMRNKRNFRPQWYTQFPWISICISREKVLCHYCRYAKKQKWFTTREGEKTFTEIGFDNWKKAVEKFRAHENSQSHREAMLKWTAQRRPTISSQLSTQLQIGLGGMPIFSNIVIM